MRALQNVVQSWELRRSATGQAHGGLRVDGEVMLNIHGVRFSDGFVGRARELAELAALFEAGAQIITLWGPGGIGKTRLAQAAVQRMPVQRRLFCDLSAAQDLGDVCRAITAGINGSLASVTNTPSAVNAIGYALAACPTMVVLDACDRVVAAVSHALASWSATSSQVRFLATSREVLHAAGEHVLEVGGLGVDAAHGETAAVELLTARARAIGYPISTKTVATFEDIARRLDGNPLAIELAAGRLRVLSAEEILPRIESAPLEIDSAGSSTPGKLRLMMASSWELLSHTEKEVLVQCSVFVGGVTMRAFGEIDGSASAAAILQALMEKSLLHPTDALPVARFEVAKIARAFVLDVAGCEASGRARERHASAFARLAERNLAQAETSAGGEAREWLAAEIDNLTEALAFCVSTERTREAVVLALALALQVMRGGPYPPFVATLDEVLALVERSPPSPDLTVRVFARSALMRLSLGDHAVAYAQIEAALRWARQYRGGGWLTAYVLSTFAVIERWVGRLESSAVLAAEARILADSDPLFGTHAEDAKTVGNFAIIAYYGDDEASAEAEVERAIALAASFDEATVQALGLQVLGRLALRRGATERALEALTRAAHLTIETCDVATQCQSRLLLAWLALDVGDPEGARDQARMVLASCAQTGICAPKGEAVRLLGFASHQLGDLDDALTHYRLGLQDSEWEGFELQEGPLMAALCIGVVLASKGDRAGAEDAFALAADRVARSGEETVAHVVPLLRAHLDLATARPPDGQASNQFERLAIRLLHAALRERAMQSQLVVARDGMRFRSQGVVVDLARRRSLARVLHVLVEVGGVEVEPQELIARSWPDERIEARAAAQRLHTAVRRLRQLGMNDALLLGKRGYYLHPGCVVSDAI
jgi:predicted ATPase